ncbi:MAG: 1,9-bis(guanidino)-5-aza-nonane synthase [Planctomycetota bacterium]
MSRKRELLSKKIEHLSLTDFDPRSLVSGMENMAFQARNLAHAAKIYESMLRDPGCSVWLCLAGSLVSAGLKRVIYEMVSNNMVDAIVSTGANIVDQDFFEGLGFHHYSGSQFADDEELRELGIDRIYDTYIDEDELRVCDQTIADIAGALPPRPHSSREFIREMGRHLDEKGGAEGSVVLEAYRKKVPIFCPAFSDCSAGFGLVMHQWGADSTASEKLSIDSAKDFLELTRLKIHCKETGLFMVGGGVPKNFAQDTVVAAEMLGKEVQMHRYAIQITVADERDGALSGSTLKEACSWGKVSMAQEQMVYGEATVMMPLIAGYAFHQRASEGRTEARLADLLESESLAS